MNDWQPIETIPIHQDVLLGAWLERGHCGYWYMATGYINPAGVFRIPGHANFEFHKPTHWMPLPKPPASTQHHAAVGREA